MELINRFFNEYAASFFLFGPRGTGKSTWLRTMYPDSLIIDLLEPDIFREFPESSSYGYAGLKSL